jgi:hypothetical protein
VVCRAAAIMLVCAQPGRDTDSGTAEPHAKGTWTIAHRGNRQRKPNRHNRSIGMKGNGKLLPIIGLSCQTSSRLPISPTRFHLGGRERKS